MRRNKYIIALILAAVVVSAAIPLAPRAHASVPTFEVNPTINKGIIGEFVQTLYEWGETFVIESLKKRLLDMMVDQIISYVQGDGKPRFVTDWQGFLKDAGNAAAGDAAQLAGLGFLCSPFNIQLQLALAPVPTFTQQVTCTLDQIVDNVENFYDDFRNGGWLAYGELLRPQNNFYGAYLIARSAQQSAASQASAAAFGEGIAGGGFLSVKKCDANGRNCTVTTPGSVLGDTVANAIGSDFDRIIGAQQVKEYVSAIADAAFNRLIREGADGLLGVGTPRAPATGSFAPTVAGACAGLSGSLLQSCLTYARSTNNSFSLTVSTFIDQVDNTVVPRRTTIMIIEDSISLENNLIAKLEELRACRISSSTLVAQLDAEIAQEQVIVDRLTEDIANNQAIIDFVLPFRDRIEQVPEGDWAQLTIVFNDVSSFLDPTAASNALADAQDEHDIIQPNVDERIEELEREIFICRFTP